MAILDRGHAAECVMGSVIVVVDEEVPGCLAHVLKPGEQVPVEHLLAERCQKALFLRCTGSGGSLRIGLRGSEATELHRPGDWFRAMGLVSSDIHRAAQGRGAAGQAYSCRPAKSGDSMRPSFFARPTRRWPRAESRFGRCRPSRAQTGDRVLSIAHEAAGQADGRAHAVG